MSMSSLPIVPVMPLEILFGGFSEPIHQLSGSIRAQRPLEGHDSCNLGHDSRKTRSYFVQFTNRASGRGGGTRTHDLVLPKHVPYQLGHTPRRQ